MLNLLVSTFHPRTERDFPSNNPQPIEITAFLRRIYFGRACHKRPEIAKFQDVSLFFSGKIEVSAAALTLTHAETVSESMGRMRRQLLPQKLFGIVFHTANVLYPIQVRRILSGSPPSRKTATVIPFSQYFPEALEVTGSLCYIKHIMME